MNTLVLTGVVWMEFCIRAIFDKGLRSFETFGTFGTFWRRKGARFIVY